MIIPNMLLVGATGRNAGKTTFCTDFISKWHKSYDIIGVKFTTIHFDDGHCHHGEDSCGACMSFEGAYEIIEERHPSGGKDTCALLRAGALKVYWVRAKILRLAEAAGRVMAAIPKDMLVVCESNSLSDFVTPGVIVVTHRSGFNDIKPSAKSMLEKADFIVDVGDSESLNAAMENIIIAPSNGGIRLTGNR